MRRKFKAMQRDINGKAVDWLEHVSDEQYHAGAQSTA